MVTDYHQQLRHLIKEALREDIGSGDHSTLSCIPEDQEGRAVLKIKENGLLAGVDVAKEIFHYLDPEASFELFKHDGETVHAGEQAFIIATTTPVILKGERLTLNCMQRMSGIATLTRQYVDLLQGYHTKVLDTRKTTPNFRLLEKEAVKIGGGTNHRFGLYDMIMLKDNHIDFCGGIEKAIEKAADYVARYQPGLRIEVETRDLDDVRKVLKAGKNKVFRIMLDNYTPEQVKEAVDLIGGAMETEASGGINLQTIQSYAETGVDFVSVGGLIHQARSLDLSLKAI